MSIIIDPSDVEADTSPLAADAGDEAGFGLLVGSINGADVHDSTHHLQQPVGAVHLVVFEGHMQ